MIVLAPAVIQAQANASNKASPAWWGGLPAPGIRACNGNSTPRKTTQRTNSVSSMLPADGGSPLRSRRAKARRSLAAAAACAAQHTARTANAVTSMRTGAPGSLPSLVSQRQNTTGESAASARAPASSSIREEILDVARFAAANKSSFSASAGFVRSSRTFTRVDRACLSSSSATKAGTSFCLSGSVMDDEVPFGGSLALTAGATSVATTASTATRSNSIALVMRPREWTTPTEATFPG